MHILRPRRKQGYFLTRSVGVRCKFISNSLRKFYFLYPTYSLHTSKRIFPLGLGEELSSSFSLVPCPSFIWPAEISRDPQSMSSLPCLCPFHCLALPTSSSPLDLLPRLPVNPSTHLRLQITAQLSFPSKSLSLVF